MRSLDAVAAAIIIVMMLRTQALKRDATTKKSKFGLLLAANKSDRELLIEKVDIHLLLLFSLLPSSSPHNFTEKLIALLLPYPFCR